MSEKKSPLSSRTPTSSSSSSSGDDYQYPELYHFPPFFTLQPAAETRSRQLGMWRDLVVNYCRQKKVKQIVIGDDAFTLFRNKNINRQLDTGE